MSGARDYPIPANAVYLWHRGDALAIGLPEGQTLFLPLSKLEFDRASASQRGWEILLSLLQERRGLDSRAQLGTPAMPTRVQVEQLLVGRKVEGFDVAGKRKLAEGDLWQEEQGK